MSEEQQIEEPVLNEHQKKVVGLGKVVHAAIAAFNETMGDFTYGSWEQTPPWYQSVMVECVTFVLQKPRDVHQLHVYWCQLMTNHGWTYGILLNPETKEHPNLKNFREISFEEQIKHAIFISIVIAVSPALVRPANEHLDS